MLIVLVYIQDVGLLLDLFCLIYVYLLLPTLPLPVLRVTRDASNYVIVYFRCFVPQYLE